MALLARLRDWLARRYEARRTRRRTLHGVPVTVFNVRPDIDDDTLFARTEAALGLVAEHDPRRFRRLSRDLALVHVHRGFTRGAYHHDSRSCILDNTFVANPAFTVAEVAACLVHEAMHARVAAMGVRRPASDAARAYAAREERVCRRAEIAFARRLPPHVPGAAAVIERAEGILSVPDQDAAPAIDYAEVRRRVIAADLQALQAPEWMKRLIARRRGVAWPPTVGRA